MCLCDYVNICMYLVLLFIFGKKAPESLCLLLCKKRIQIKFSYFILFLSYVVVSIILCCVFELFFSSPGHRPCELLSWVSIRPSVSFSHLNLLLWNRWTEISQTCQKCSLDGPLPDLCFWCWFEIQHGCQGP